ncbi:hypothetical protein VQM69_02685 [Helicobacter pylori]
MVSFLILYLSNSLSLMIISSGWLSVLPHCKAKFRALSKGVKMEWLKTA